MDEHLESPPAEDERQHEQPEPPERPLTQRELVRASLLRCPPQQPSEPAR